APRLLLAPAADHDRDAGPGDRLRRVEQPRRLVVLPVVPALAAERLLEHLVRDLEGLLEHLEADAAAREGKTQPLRLLLVPGRADPEPGAAAGQDVQGRGGLHPQARVAVMHA